jgi:hypothetical protein
MTYRITITNHTDSNVHGGAASHRVATLYSVVNGDRRFVEDASAEVCVGGQKAADAKALRQLRIYLMLRRDARRETQAAFMAATAAPTERCYWCGVHHAPACPAFGG